MDGFEYLEPMEGSSFEFEEDVPKPFGFDWLLVDAPPLLFLFEELISLFDELPPLFEELTPLLVLVSTLLPEPRRLLLLLLLLLELLKFELLLEEVGFTVDEPALLLLDELIPLLVLVPTFDELEPRTLSLLVFVVLPVDELALLLLPEPLLLLVLPPCPVVDEDLLEFPLLPERFEPVPEPRPPPPLYPSYPPLEPLGSYLVLL